MKNRVLLLLCAVFLVGGLVMLGCEKSEKPKAPSDKGDEAAESAPPPAKPEAPEIPEVPDKPELPEVPDAPKVPDKPELPEAPDAPKVPDKPELPKAPDVPKLPDKPAAGAKQKTAWADAKVGDMVKYKMMNNMTQTQEVTKVDAENVYLKTLIEMPNMKMPARETKMPRFVTPAKGEEPKTKVETKDLGTKTIKVGGKDLKCKGTETKMQAGGKTTTSRAWMCDQVPGGTVLMESPDAKGKMQATMTLVEFKKGS